LLAEKYGPYPDYSFESYKDSPFFNSLEPSTKERIEMHGLRNATLLTAAPTGTTGTMVGASTGIEPYFALEWTRNSRLGSFTERVSTLEGVDLANLPDYFVTAQELTPEEHIYMQAIIQKHVDASISKTINLPSSTTVTGVAEVYQMLYDSGCKGGTIYRDQSRSEQVLQLTTPKGEIVDVELSVHKNENVCPKCGENSLVKESGCITCSNCGYSYCTL
jgi:ribonucleoside-diphosphate reductase alpha chain